MTTMENPLAQLALHAEKISSAIAWAAFILILAALMITLIIEIMLQPRTRAEWSEIGKITAFNMVMWRTVYQLLSGNSLPLPFAAFWWVIISILVSFYIYVLVDDFGPAVFRRVCAWCKTKWGIAIWVTALITFVWFVYLNIT
jgi:hypothetical protein